MCSTCTISIVRIKFLNLGTDYTYANVAPAAWSLSELCAGIICACLPTMRPLFFRAATSRRKSSSSTAYVTRGSTSLPLKSGSGGRSPTSVVIAYAPEDSSCELRQPVDEERGEERGGADGGGWFEFGFVDEVESRGFSVS